MAYIGAQPNKQLTKTTSQSFNGTGSATAFTLNRAVNTGEELEVFVDNVQQEPGVGKSYTATGTTLTFDEAPPLGTGNVYVIYRGQAEVTTRLEAPDLSITTAKLAADAVSTAKIADDAVTSAKLDTNIDIAGTLDSTGVITADAGIKLNLSSSTVTGQTVTTNTLTDFEQGTWTPTSSYGSLSYNRAHYVKIGNMVTIWCQVYAFTDSSGNALYVEGLPYASASGWGGTGVVMHQNVNISNEDDITMYIAGSASNFRLFKIRANGSWSTITHNLLQSNHEFYISFSYLTS